VGEREVVHSLINLIILLVMVSKLFFILEEFVGLDECRSFHLLVLLLVLDLLRDADSLAFELVLLVGLDLVGCIFFVTFAFFTLVHDLGKEVVEVRVVKHHPFSEPRAVFPLNERVQEGIRHLG